MNKRQLREQISDRLAQRSDDQRAELSRRLTQQLLEQSYFQQANAILLYWPLADEIDTRPLAEAAWQMNKIVTVPMIAESPTTTSSRPPSSPTLLQPVHWRQTSQPTKRGVCGIAIPQPTERYPLDQIDLILLPALAYDSDRYRLGRGGGFYDYLLAHLPTPAVTCGWIADWQQTVALPRESHDRPVDHLLMAIEEESR